MIVPTAVTDAQLGRAHEADYLHRVQHGLLTQSEIRRIGLPWSSQLVNRARHSVGATIAASRSALRDGISASLGGGTHHACYCHGEGFCLYNDAVVAARTMQAEGRVRRVAVIDCDVHQGNGTADITREDASIFTFSIHGEKNFPFRKIPGDLDIGLPDGTGDEAYLAALKVGLKITLDRSQADLAIYLAGADVHEHDRLGRLSLTPRGIATRDRLVLEECQRIGLPVALTMAGGYGRDLHETVAIQLRTIQIASEFAG
jgi:acetoin utilization deacetylase AcuC-like enzyme